MIAGHFWEGSGLGNQLARYVATRVHATNNGWDFGMINPELFKGNSFMRLDMGCPITKPLPLWYEERIDYNGVDVRAYDFRFEMVKDNTLIDGEFQHPRYFMHRIDEIRNWLLPTEMYDFTEDNICIINFRGGEYQYFPELYLTQKYWDDAIKNMRILRPDMVFKVVTDDVDEAHKFFPDFEISHDMAEDYKAIQTAPYLILSNSSFAIFPALLNKRVKAIIAPKYWARHNVSDGYWATEQNKYHGWWYQDREGNLQMYEMDS